MRTWLKKTILYAVITFSILSAIASYTRNEEPTHELVSETFEVLTEGQQLIRVDIEHQCGEWIHYALDETIVPETLHYVADELDLMADIIIAFTDENGGDIDNGGCRINELKLTLVGVGM